MSIFTLRFSLAGSDSQSRSMCSPTYKTGTCNPIIILKLVIKNFLVNLTTVLVNVIAIVVELTRNHRG
jgi:hypothetical protein